MQGIFIVKEGVDINDLMLLQPALFYALGVVTLYTHQNNLPLVITSILEHVEGRQSKTHFEGRAVDISTRGWTHNQIFKFCDHFNKKLYSLGAISANDGERKFCVYHAIEGGEYHLHLQVAPRSVLFGELDRIIN